MSLTASGLCALSADVTGGYRRATPPGARFDFNVGSIIAARVFLHLVVVETLTKQARSAFDRGVNTAKELFAAEYQWAVFPASVNLLSRMRNNAGGGLFSHHSGRTGSFPSSVAVQFLNKSRKLPGAIYLSENTANSKWSTCESLLVRERPADFSIEYKR
ncbi:hypothetical protein D9757_001564 [Collybiopsis confluens]|uniref:Uncharacterized protein n=1 Tax=Collybiopsis confluens TaxID=2823264 RepID=A0A8H5MFC4_9AGAR|nr:hypothetical protein D9757_001564 [Collybiopsis confluens]